MIEKFVNKITLGDCIDILKKIPDDSVQVTFADPPFNLGKKYNSYKDTLRLQEYLNWCEEWITEMVRITKPDGSIFLHNIPKWLTFFSGYLNKLAYFKHWISWDAPTAPMGKSLQPSHYGILFYTKLPNKSKIYEIRSPHKRDRKTGYLLKDYGGKKEQLHPFGPLVSDVWTDIHRIRHTKFRDEHPCQLPVHLLERLILMTTDKEDIILDPFMGTGTTAIAAKKLCRNFVGIELDENYQKIANDKIKKTKRLSIIGDSFVSVHLNDTITIRNKDWESLKKFFKLPTNPKDIDFFKISLKDKNIVKSIVNDDIEDLSMPLFHLETEKKNLLNTVAV